MMPVQPTRSHGFISHLCREKRKQVSMAGLVRVAMLTGRMQVQVTESIIRQLTGISAVQILLITCTELQFSDLFVFVQVHYIFVNY